MPILLGDSNIKKLAEIVKEGRNVFMPPYNVPVYDMKKKRHQLFASEQMLKILLEYFLIKLIREYNFSINAEDGAEAPLLINEIIAYVTDNYLEKITIDELAFLFKTNRATLCRDFKKSTGKTIIEFINTKKFESAKYMIINSNDTFTKIAEELNFESIHYFTRFFKKMSGMTPKDFRKKNGKMFI
jgi:YesN/AraC family two-component response regulator